jgi:hypothetical protein
VHKIVWKRIAQHVPVCCKEPDPFFQKIIRLKHYIEKNDYTVLRISEVFTSPKPNKKIGVKNFTHEMEKLPADFLLQMRKF